MAEKLTPLLCQYWRIKQRYPETILLFRVGEFYEMFYEDAEIGARALNLTLTSRPHGPHIRVPLAGIPVKTLDSYVARLVAQGFKVAICDQLEEPDPKKPVVYRDVVEIITPGTVARTSLLEESKNNYLLSISPHGEKWGMAFADLSTGEFWVAELKPESIGEEIAKITPAEIILPKNWPGNIDGINNLRITKIDDYYFTEEFAFVKLTAHLGVVSLSGFGIEHLTEGICAAGAIIQYLEHTQRSALPHLKRISPYNTHEFLLIDRITRRNLELTEKIQLGEQKNDLTGTLFWVLNHTKTPGGARVLRRWILTPLLSVEKINARLCVIEDLLCAGSVLDELAELLNSIGDIQRIASRIALGRANARELIALRNWLNVVPEIKSRLNKLHSVSLNKLSQAITDFPEVVTTINQTLVDTPPLGINEGGLIRAGVNKELDELRDLTINAKDYIAQLQKTERERTGIPNLRIGYNSVFGYYIEITKSYLNLVPKNYIRKQTVANGERFITPELKELEAKILTAEERIKTIEYQFFTELRNRISSYTDQMLELAETIAELDVYVSLATVARDRNYVRPIIDQSGIIEIKAGRHPVVEAMLKEQFIPNDTKIDTESEQILIITGPNMAGKSTYLRQVALIIIMAQMGSFVPAAFARIGAVDQIFTRIGASDDVTRGVSTFLAEMTETANILNNATNRSLVILDEVGRGTSTHDGLAIAWATVEHLHNDEQCRPRTLFATHYRELTDIATLLLRVKNYSFLVQEKGEQVTFLRKLQPGPADRSYGIAVAKLAGLPEKVLCRAKELLKSLSQAEEISLSQLNRAIELPIIAENNQRHPVVERLLNLKIEALTPLQALNFLAELKRLAEEKY